MLKDLLQQLLLEWGCLPTLHFKGHGQGGAERVDLILGKTSPMGNLLLEIENVLACSVHHVLAVS